MYIYIHIHSHSDYQEFPSRLKVINEFVNELAESLPHKNYPVSIDCSARLGYELLWQKIYEKFNQPIHVDPQLYDAYCSMGTNIAECITRSASTTRFHACGSKPLFDGEYSALPCCLDAGNNYLRVKPAAFWFGTAMQTALAGSANCVAVLNSSGTLKTIVC